LKNNYSHIATRWQSLSELALPIAVYALAAIIISWPAVTQLGIRGLGAGYGDQFENARLVWWTQYALQHGSNPFYQSMLGYPDGFFSAAQWAQPLGYLPAVALSFATGPVAAVTLWTLIELVLNGLSAYVLCRALLATSFVERLSTTSSKLIDGRLAALIGGLVFLAFPAIQGHLNAGHINVLALYGLPMYTLCLWRITSGNAKWQTILLGALMLVITATGDTDQAVYTLFPVTLFWLGYYAIWQRKIFWTRPIISQLSMLFILGMLFLIPFFMPLALQLSASIKSADLQQGGWVSYSVDPLSFAALSPFTPWGAVLAPSYTRIILGINSVEGSAYLGIIVIVLCFIGLLARKHRPFLLLPWLTVALGAAVFSLGPFLKWGDQLVTYTLGTYRSYITLPWAFFQGLPILNASRTPGRFNLTTALAIAVLAASGAYVGLSRLPRRIIQIGVTIGLIFGIGFEYQLFAPALTTSAVIPAYMANLAQRNDVRAVFDIPWDDNLAAKDALYWQTAHHKPMIAGQTLRTTPVDPAKLVILQAASIGDIGAESDETSLALLDQAGIDVVIVHLSALPTDISISQISHRLGLPIFRDDRIAVYDVPKTTPHVISQEVISKLSADHQALYIYAPMNGYLYFRATSDQLLGLIDTDGQVAGLYNGSVYLTAGYHIIQREPLGMFTNAPFSFERDKAVPDLRFAQHLALRAADLTYDSQRFNLKTTWKAEQALNGDYHFFVHLVGANGQSMAQSDSQPGGGLFPTKQWRAGQNWTESTTLSLANILPGIYDVMVGWYSYPDMNRLTIDSPQSGNRDNLIFIGQVIVPAPGDFF